WRGILDDASGTDRRGFPGAIVVDLCRPTGMAAGGELVELARTGVRDRESETAPPAAAPRDETRTTTTPIPSISRQAAHRTKPAKSLDNGSPPDLAAPLAAPDWRLSEIVVTAPPSRPRKTLLKGAAAIILVVIAAGLLALPAFRERLRV